MYLIKKIKHQAFYMTIEIHSPPLKVSEKTLDFIKKKVTDLSHAGENISRAEIFLIEENVPGTKTEGCKIRLDIFGDTLFVHQTANTFEKAARSAIKILRGMLKKRFEARGLPPDKITTTVKV